MWDIAAEDDVHPLVDSFMSLASALSDNSVDNACPPEDLSDSITRRFHDEVDRMPQPSPASADKVGTHAEWRGGGGTTQSIRVVHTYNDDE